MLLGAALVIFVGLYVFVMCLVLCVSIVPELLILCLYICISSIVRGDMSGIYIKSNPGTNGTGIIENIVYRDIYMDTPLWWPIWIGPQQQNQPGESVAAAYLFTLLTLTWLCVCRLSSRHGV